MMQLYWNVADGFHRLAKTVKSGATKVRVKVLPSEAFGEV